MRCSSQVKPISYSKANAAEVLARLAEQREPLVITQNGEAKAVLQDVASFEETRENPGPAENPGPGPTGGGSWQGQTGCRCVARMRAKRTTAG